MIGMNETLYHLCRLHQLAEADKAGSILGALDMAKVACALHELSKYKELGDLDRLRELVQADREGRCEIHAAKDGDTVYSIFAYVNGLHIRKSNGKPITKITSYVVNDFTRNTVDIEFMKTVFPTIESAEQALKEVEKDG